MCFPMVTLSLCHSLQETFLGSHCEWGSCWKTYENLESSLRPKAVPPEFLVLMLVHTQPLVSCQEWICKCSCQVRVPAPGQLLQLWFSAFACLSHCRPVVCPMISVFREVQRRSMIKSFGFFSCKDKWEDPHIPCWALSQTLNIQWRK